MLRGQRRLGSGRIPSRPTRLLVVATGTLLALTLAPAPSGAAPSSPGTATDDAAAGRTGSSAAGDGNLVPDDEYVRSADPDSDVEATVGPVRDDACTKLDGDVSPADVATYQEKYGGASPEGEGRWRYQVCAQTDADSRRFAAQYPDPGAAKAHCATAANRCAVLVVWEPKDPEPQPRVSSPGRKLDPFSGWLEFTPRLATSPGDRQGLIVNLPTWVWDRNTADVRGICLPLYGGVCGFAVRLSTTWETQGRRFCSGPGREYRRGRDDPRSASSCGWTYRNQGRYTITGCKTWLVVVWRLPWYIPIVFPLTLCNTDQVGVQEAQVLAGGRRRGVRVG